MYQQRIQPVYVRKKQSLLALRADPGYLIRMSLDGRLAFSAEHGYQFNGCCQFFSLTCLQPGPWLGTSRLA